MYDPKQIFTLLFGLLLHGIAWGGATQSVLSLQTDGEGNPILSSDAFVVASQATGIFITQKDSARTVPIASITKLMTAMVVLDADQSLNKTLKISAHDIDRLKGSRSRLAVGTQLPRATLLNLALMSSENRAASALARYYPGGTRAFVKAMNIKAQLLGMNETRFVDSTGLNPGNVSSPRDLVKLVRAATNYPKIRHYTTMKERHIRAGKRTLRFGNSNGLIGDPGWTVRVSKTGYIREAGRCLVMDAVVKGQPVIMVLMSAHGRYSRVEDAKKVKHWLETLGRQNFLALAHFSN